MPNHTINQIEVSLSKRKVLLEEYCKSFKNATAATVEIPEEIKELELDIIFQLNKHSACCLLPDYIIEVLAKLGHSPMLISNDENQFQLTQVGYFANEFVTGSISDSLWSSSIKEAVISYLNKLHYSS